MHCGPLSLFFLDNDSLFQALGLFFPRSLTRVFRFPPQTESLEQAMTTSTGNAVKVPGYGTKRANHLASCEGD